MTTLTPTRARRARALLLGAAIVAVLGQAPSTLADTTVVSPGAVDGWQFQHSHCAGGSSTGSGDFAAGPATPPLGAGSVHLSIGADGDSFETVRQSGYHLTRLADLGALSYSTYVTTFGSGGQAPYLILNVDTTGDETLDDQLFFEPVYQTGAYGGDPVPNQGDVLTGAWQAWDALAGGWWSLNAGTFGPPLTTIASYMAANPDARIVNTGSGAGGLRIATGCGGAAWAGFSGATDALTVTASGVETVFDLDPSPGAPTVAIDAGDYVNASEVAAVTLSGTFAAASSVLASITNNGDCGATLGETTPIEATLDQDAGTWTAGPFDLSDADVFPEGSTICAYATATLANGEQSEVGTSSTSVIDTVAPAAGTVSFDDADGVVNAAEAAAGVDVSWTAADGSDATGATLGFVAADETSPAACAPVAGAASGAATAAASCVAALPDGEIGARVLWTDDAGNASDEAAATIQKDTQIALDILSPATGALVAPQVELSGTADEGSAIVVSSAGEALGSTSAADGTWHVAVSRPVGAHTLTVQATDPAGNEAGDSVGVVVDARIPVILTPTQDSLVQGVPSVTGTSSAYGTIEIFEGGTRLLSIKTDANGNWRTPVGFSDGEHTIVARWLDEIGTPTAYSAPRTFVADGGGPTAAITTANDSRYLPPDTVSIAGTATDNRTVTRIELRYRPLIGPEIVVDADCTGCGTPSASWTHSPTLETGIYTVVARAHDASGQVSAPSSIRIVRL